MNDLRLIVLSGAAFLGAWHLGFLAGQQSKRDRTNLAQTRDALAVYKLLGMDTETAKSALRFNVSAQQKAT